MNNERLGHAILQLGLLPREIVSAAFRRVGPGGDLCAFLIAHGRLTEADAQRVRALAAGAGAPPGAEQDQVATLRRQTASGPAVAAGPFVPPQAASSDGELTVLGGSVELARAAAAKAPGASSDGELTVLGGSVDVERTVLRASSSDGESTVMGGDGRALATSDSQDDVELTRRASSDHLLRGASGERAVPSGASGASALSLSSPSAILDLLPGFEIERELGRGGMGMVVLAKKGGRRHVIKLMTALDPSVEELERFKREARAVERLVHPNIIRLLEFGEIHGVPYFSMEYLKGEDLKELVTSRIAETGEPPSMDWVVETMHAVACGLAHAHDAGIVHRDLKPANILIEEKTKRPIIIDFGLAKGALSESYAEGDALTRTGEALGTPAYMAPEQMDAGQTKTAEPKNDVWGLAATLFYALTGEAPYTGATAINIYKQLMTGPPKPVREVNPAVPSWLEELLEACFQTELDDRASLDQVIEALETRSSACLDLEAVRARKARRRLVRGLAIAAAVPTVILLVLLVGKMIQDLRPVVRPLSVTLTAREDAGPVSQDSLSGRVAGDALSSAKAYVRVGEELPRKLELAADGSFEISLKGLGDGPVRVRVSARADSEEAPEVDRTYRLERVPPELESIGNRLTADRLEISGRLSENGCRVKLGENEATVTGRHFSLSLTEPPETDELVVVDSAGKETRREAAAFRILGPKSEAPDLTQAVRESRPGDLILLRPGRYEKVQLRIRVPLTLLGIKRGRKLGDSVSVASEEQATSPRPTEWPILECDWGEDASGSESRSALIGVQLARSDGNGEGPRPKVTLRHLVLLHHQRDHVKRHTGRRKNLSDGAINNYRDVVMWHYGKAIQSKRLSVRQSELAVLGQRIDLGEITDQQVRALIKAHRKLEGREFKESDLKVLAPLYPRDLALNDLAWRFEETPLRIDQGAVELDHCVVDSSGYFTVLCGPPLEGGQPNQLVARHCWFNRGSVQGLTVVGGKAIIEDCHFAERLKKSITSWRYSKWPFVMNHLGQLVLFNGIDAEVRRCHFSESRDCALLVNQSNGAFGTEVRGRILVEGCHIQDCRDEAIDLGTCTTAVIRDTVVEKSFQEGLYARGGDYDVLLENSRFVRCGKGRYKDYTNFEEAGKDYRRDERIRQRDAAKSTPAIFLRSGGTFRFRGVKLLDSYGFGLHVSNTNVDAQDCEIIGGTIGVLVNGPAKVELRGSTIRGQSGWPLAEVHFDRKGGRLTTPDSVITPPETPVYKPRDEQEKSIKPFSP